jgi:uncharacterized phage protein (TIGR01671 family)
MNRERKYRAWDGEQMYLSPALSEGAHHLANWFEAHSVFGAGKESQFMDWTGLIDKKGKEIYEGDIVSYGNRLYEVAINFNGFYLQRYKLWNGKFKPAFTYALSLITKPRKEGDRGENGGVVDSAEVIGNIYQNPELLSKIKD